MGRHEGPDLVGTMIVALVAIASITLLVLVLVGVSRQGELGGTGSENTCQRYGDC
jgi:preprotein translocase subunit SecG